MATRKRGGLGSGLGNLIPSNQRETKDSPVDVFFSGAQVQQRDEEVHSVEKPSQKKTKTSPQAGKTQKKTTKATQAKAKKKTSASRTKSGVSDGDLVAVPGVTYGEIELDLIVPNTRQPRSVFDEDELAELADSIKEVGVLQPVIVRPLEKALPDAPTARYELIMGERRWRASRLAGLTQVPAIVRRTADEDLLRDALLENLHRAQLNPLEEAAAYQQLLEDFQCTQEELSRRIARSRPQISNTLRLLKLPPLVQRRVAAGVISAGHARALLSLTDPASMEKLAQRIVAETMSVRQVEEIVAMADDAEAPEHTSRTRAVNPELDDVAQRLGDYLDTKVKVNMGARKGAIRIDFAGMEDLNRILQLLAPDNGLV